MGSLIPDQIVSANIRLVRKLGEGGMGSVWVGDHLTLHTQVAVKFMSTTLAGDGSATARFTREATAAAQIKSPHVVQTFDHGITPAGVPYIVMELLEGEDLGDRIERCGPLTLQETAKVLTQSCKALAKAHSLGIVHRDIKPDNIFLISTEDDVYVKVLDFGIAKQAGADGGFHMTRTGSMMGTPYYMSPEQLVDSKSVDYRTDLWSLAVVVYHCLTAALPFNAETFAGLCITIDRGTFSPPSMLRGQLPPAVDAWFQTAMQRNPALRFASAKEMSDAFNIAVDPSCAARAPMISVPEGVPMGGVPATTNLSGAKPGTLSGAATTSPSVPKRSNAGLVIGTAAAGALLLATAVAGVFFFVSRKPTETSVAAAASDLRPVASAPAESAPVVVEPPVPSASGTPAETASAAPEPPTTAVAANPPSTGRKSPSKDKPEGTTAPAKPDKPPTKPPEVDRGF